MLDFKLKTITDADFFYIPKYIKEEEASDFFERLRLQIDWKTESNLISVFLVCYSFLLCFIRFLTLENL